MARRPARPDDGREPPVPQAGGEARAKGPAMLTVKEAAGYAGVSAAIVRGWIRDGELPHHRLGGKGKRGKILIRPAHLDTLIDSREVKAKGPGPRKSPARSATKPPRAVSLKHLRLPS